MQVCLCVQAHVDTYRYTMEERRQRVQEREVIYVVHFYCLGSSQA